MLGFKHLSCFGWDLPYACLYLSETWVSSDFWKLARSKCVTMIFLRIFECLCVARWNTDCVIYFVFEKTRVFSYICTYIFFIRKNQVYSLELSLKSDFQPSTTKQNNREHPTIKTDQVWALGGFKGWFFILWKLKIFKLI